MLSSNSSKKRTKQFDQSTVRQKKWISSFVFWKNHWLEKKHYDFAWPLMMISFRQSFHLMNRCFLEIFLEFSYYNIGQEFSEMDYRISKAVFSSFWLFVFLSSFFLVWGLSPFFHFGTLVVGGLYLSFQWIHLQITY